MMDGKKLIVDYCLQFQETTIWHSNLSWPRLSFVQIHIRCFFVAIQRYHDVCFYSDTFARKKAPPKIQAFH